MSELHPLHLQQLVKAFTSIPVNRTLGFEIDHVNTKQAQLHFAMKDDLVGNYLLGILHGGVISSVLDTIGGILCMAAVMHKHADKPATELAGLVGKVSTVDLQVNFIRPGKGSMFIASSSMVKCGNKIAFTRMELVNQEQSLIATGTGTFIVK